MSYDPRQKSSLKRRADAAGAKLSAVARAHLVVYEDSAVFFARPPEGMPPEKLTQILQCHSARALLGQIDQSQVQNDPYWLPNAWLDIDVKSQPGGYAISISADSVHNGLEVLARANAYADTRMATRGAEVH